MQASLHAQFRLLFCRETLLTWGTKASQCALRHAKPNAPRAQTLVSGAGFLLGSLQACQRLLWEGRLLLFPLIVFAFPFVFAFAFAGAFAAGPRRAPLSRSSMCVSVCASACVRARVGGWTATALHVPTHPLHAPYTLQGIPH